ncbi:MAG: peptide chain release factor N(5)-glutamine methyltransferase [Gammaproteobacteria bacterium]|nr:peptide chain release factor N(5)-glutamine methyltransferase [Gammaproteobacteria bacterium]
MPPTIRTALARAACLLNALPNARLDAEVLLSHVLGVQRSYLYTWPERRVDEEQAFQELIARRARGEPVAYLTGSKEFRSLLLRVTPAVLIPRPETELLVERALAYLPLRRSARVIDLGTGSGAIALAIAHERPRCRILATDCCVAALAVARQNALRLELGNVEFAAGDWFTAPGLFQAELIIANPPYIAAHDSHLDGDGVRYEPRHALAAGLDGLDALRHIVPRARRYLAADGHLLLEHGYDQADAVTNLLLAHGYTNINVNDDLNGHARISEATL